MWPIIDLWRFLSNSFLFLLNWTAWPTWVLLNEEFHTYLLISLFIHCKVFQVAKLWRESGYHIGTVILIRVERARRRRPIPCISGRRTSLLVRPVILRPSCNFDVKRVTHIELRRKMEATLTPPMTPDEVHTLQMILSAKIFIRSLYPLRWTLTTASTPWPTASPPSPWTGTAAVSSIRPSSSWSRARGKCARPRSPWWSIPTRLTRSSGKSMRLKPKNMDLNCMKR